MMYGNLKAGNVIRYMLSDNVGLLLVVSVAQHVGGRRAGLYDVEWLNLETGEYVMDRGVAPTKDLYADKWEIVA